MATQVAEDLQCFGRPIPHFVNRVHFYHITGKLSVMFWGDDTMFSSTGALQFNTSLHQVVHALAQRLVPHPVLTMVLISECTTSSSGR